MALLPTRELGRGHAGRCRYRGPGPSRPAGGALCYRSAGVVMSTAPHGRPYGWGPGTSTIPIKSTATVSLALLAAVITAWLGLVAHFGGMITGDAADSAGRIPDRLAVVRVQPGETLRHLAARVSPDAPAYQVTERIRELNALDSSALVAGQTLIAPVG
jgi:hypothetical protein